MPDKKIDVVVIGTIIKETIIFPDHKIGPVIGSPAAYSSLVMAAQGRRVGIVTYYGHDMDNIIGELDVLDRQNILPYAHTTTNNLNYRVDGSKFVEYREVTPNLAFSDICGEYLKSDFFKICPMNYEVELEIPKKLYAMGKTVFVDLGGYGGATSDIRHSVNEKCGKDIIDTLCKNATIIKASQEDLESIIPGRDVEGAADYLIKAGARNVVITLGSKGVFYIKEGSYKSVIIPPFKTKSEIPDGSLDFTGAGDSFGAGFMASYIVDQDIHKAAINGNATASLVIQKTGGCTFSRMPSSEAVQSRICEMY